MSIIIGGTTVDTVVYNGTTLDEVFYNNTKVYESSIKSVLTVAYGANVSSVSVDGVTIPNGGTFDYKPGDSKSIVVNYSGYVTGDGYVHSVNNNTTLNSTRWKYNTSYSVSGIEKTVTVSTNLVAVSNTIAFTLTDAEVESLPSGTITFNAAKSGTQTYKSKQVQVPYTAYAWDSAISGSCTVNYKNANGATHTFNLRFPDTSFPGYTQLSTKPSASLRYMDDGGTSRRIEVRFPKGMYYDGKQFDFYNFSNLTIKGNQSGIAWMNNKSGNTATNGKAIGQYSYTAYRTETQYYWE